MIRWRVGRIWYVLAVGLPLAVHPLTVTLNLTMGAPTPPLSEFSALSGVILAFAVRLINPLDDSVGEEPCWRGFALPRLQTGRLPLLATLILALLVAYLACAAPLRPLVPTRSTS
jgi:CAAX protease family protein